jgi:hypothetical protein
MWEYPRDTPDGEQMAFVEVMELKGGLIQHHRVYWGLVRALNLKKRPTLTSPHCTGMNPPSLMGALAERGIPGSASASPSTRAGQCRIRWRLVSKVGLSIT